MAFDVAFARGLFPALGEGWIHLDAQAGMQIPDAVAVAVSRAVRTYPVAAGPIRPQALAAAETLDGARRAVADLLRADPAGVVLGPTRGVLLSALIDSLGAASVLGPGQVVVSRLDDEETLRPWLRAAERGLVSLAWAEVDIEDGSLPVWQYGELLAPHTSVVAAPLASSATGVVVDVAAIGARARQAGALMVVDATAAAPYLPLSIDELGADVVLVSAERWGGPEIAAMVFADPDVLDRLPSVALDGAGTGPARLEERPASAVALAGLIASVEHLAGLDPDIGGKRRQRLTVAQGGVESYLQRLTKYLVESLANLGHVRVLAPDADRVPAVSFTVDRVAADAVCRRLADNGISALSGLPSRCLRAMGAGDFGGAVTVGLAPYSTPYEVDQLARVLGSFG